MFWDSLKTQRACGGNCPTDCLCVLDSLKNTRRPGGNKTQKQHKSIKCEFLVRSEEKAGRFYVNFNVLSKNAPRCFLCFGID